MARSSLVPGFRFHPTDIELVMYYLKRKLLGKKIIVDAIAEVNIYDFSPWDLPDLSSLKNGDLEWFFFCPKSKKYSSGARYNRATETGFWKATGKDRKVEYKKRNVATIKTLVYHVGHAGTGQRTDWVMHEYRMEDEQLANAGVVQDMYVLVKVFEKAGSGPKNGAQYGAPFIEEAWDDEEDVASGSIAIAVEATTNPMEGAAAMEMLTLPQITQNVCWTDPGPSVVTFSANALHGNVLMEGPAGMEMMTVSQNTQNMYWTDPGSSIVTLSANEIREDVPVSDDLMLLEEIAVLLGVSTKDLIGNNENQEVGVGTADKFNSMAPNENNGIFNELANLINLDELNGGVPTSFKPADGPEYTHNAGGVSTSFNTNGAEYTHKEIFTADDLDFDLSEFYVD